MIPRLSSAFSVVFILLMGVLVGQVQRSSAVQSSVMSPNGMSEHPAIIQGKVQGSVIHPQAPTTPSTVIPTTPAALPTGAKQPVTPGQPVLPNVPTPPSDTQQIKEVIEDQLKAVRSFDPSKAYYAYTSKEFQKTVPLDDFKVFLQQFPPFFRNKSVSFQDINFKEGIATYKVKLTSTDGETQDVEYLFISEDGLWRVLTIKIVKPEPKKF